MKIGVLDIQGSVEEHVSALERIGVEAVCVKKAGDLDDVAGLVLPGGESTTIDKLLRESGLSGAILERVEAGMCVWGTCAGAILMAKWITDGDGVTGLGLMDITVQRNAYGRQLDSFEGEVEFDGRDVPTIFIRAPRIVEVGSTVEVLAKVGEDIVAAREGNFLVTTFHPELTMDSTVHEYFLRMC